ncbi:MAG: leucine-rich repeat domain-containing protein, partial [Clostridia bacterium]|nr:leucine-rich repeat domain-containing protein [Clostridia bacterium]
GLKSVNIPENVSNIGSSAFEGCSKITSVNIPKNVSSIGSSAFKGCSSLESVSISDGVKSIGSSAFAGCSKLENISLPESLEKIEDNAFKNCILIIVITIPENVQFVGEGILDGCVALKTVYVEGDIAPEGLEEAIKSALEGIVDGDIELGLGAEKGHSFGSWITEKEPTCTTEGYRYHVCSECNKISGESISALGHTEVTLPRVEPTEDKDGLTEGKKCSVCDTVILAQQIIPALGAADNIDPWEGDIATKFAGGKGTSSDPYLISNAAELALFANMIYNEDPYIYDKNFKLTADINLGGHNWRPIGNFAAGTLASSFRGVFDGAGHKVYNFKISAQNESSRYMYGLFEFTMGATIKNLGVEDFEIEIGNHKRSFLCVGGIVGNTNNTDIENCYSRGIIKVSSLQDNLYAGGIVGYLHSESSIKNCYSATDVTAEANRYCYVGGLVGKCSRTNITNSFAVGNLSSDEVAGALIGNTEYTYYVSDCFACNSQKIVAPSVINTGVKAFYDADVFNTADFFRFKISWNNPLWNTADLDFANGKYPTLIPQ